MYQKKLTLPSGESFVLELNEGWTELFIRMNGTVIGSIHGKEALQKGETFVLPSGQEIRALLAVSRPEVWYEDKELITGRLKGKPFPSSGAFHAAIRALIFIGVLQLVIAALFLMSPKDGSVWAGLGLAAVGAVLIGLALWARNKEIKLPFHIGIALCLGNILLMFYTGALGGLIATLILLIFLVRGVLSEVPLRSAPAGLDEDAPLDSGI